MSDILNKWLNRYRIILAQPDWQLASQAVSLPEKIANWLTETTSLTQKLQQISHNLQVEVIQQQWQQTPDSKRIWQREVRLNEGKIPWIFAQTVFPEITIEQVAKPILTLGNQPIGLWLFPQNPDRITLEWRYDRQYQLYARRSTLHLKGYPLEIKELFLPQFPFASKALSE